MALRLDARHLPLAIAEAVFVSTTDGTRSVPTTIGQARIWPAKSSLDFGPAGLGEYGVMRCVVLAPDAYAVTTQVEGNCARIVR